MLRDFRARLRRFGHFVCRAFALVAIAAVGIVSLSACGVKGPLKLPPAPATAPGARPADSPPAPAQEPPAAPAPAPPASEAEPPPATRP